MELKTIIRIAEVALSIVLLSLWIAWETVDTEDLKVFCGSVTGYFLIPLVFVELVCYRRFLNITRYLVLGGIIFFVCECIPLIMKLPEDDDSRTNVVIFIVLSVVNAVIFLVDFIFQIRSSDDDDSD